MINVCDRQINAFIKGYTSDSQPHVLRDYNVRETFSFVHKINQLPTSGKCMVSLDVEGLFTSIPLAECIDLAMKYIYHGNPGLTISPTDLKTPFSFATAETTLLIQVCFMIKQMGLPLGSPLHSKKSRVN